MRLAELLPGATIPQRWPTRRCRDRRPTAARCAPGRVFFAVPGSKRGRPRLRAAGAAPGRRRHRRRGAASTDAPIAARPLIEVADVRAALAHGQRAASIRASRKRSSPSPAPAARPRSPPSCGRFGRRSASRPPRSARSASSRPAGGLWLADDAGSRSRCTRRSTDSPATASPISRWRPPRTASTSAGSTACASTPAPSPISRATISTITRRSRTISRPSCGCSSACSSRGQTAPSSTPTAMSPTRSRRLRARGVCSVFTTGAQGRRPEARSAREPDGPATRLDVAYEGASLQLALPLAGAFQTANALVAAGLCIVTGGAPARVFAALEKLEGAPGRLERVGERRRRAGLRRLRAQARRAREGSAHAAALCQGPARSSSSAAAATATPASARSWARSRRGSPMS